MLRPGLEVPACARAAGRSLALALTTFALVGCGAAAASSASSTDTAESDAVEAPRETVVVASIEAAPAMVSETACSPRDEACNQEDDDCDGSVDEDCRDAAVDVEITLRWERGVDLDLYVTEPNGFQLSYAEHESPTGGRLDRDARGLCQSETGTSEVVVFPRSPPRGEYRIDVHYLNDCGEGGITPAEIEVVVSGRRVAHYRFDVRPHEQVPVAVFRL